MSETLIKVETVSKKFCRSLKRSLWYGLQDLGSEVLGRRHSDYGGLRPNEFWAVKGVSFELKQGECLGLVGRNGAGKTTLLRLLNGLIKPDQGRIEIRGRVGALISLGAGFNPILTGRENIYVNASVLGLSKREIDGKIEEIIDFAEIEGFVDTPVQSYSSGMQVRLGFSVATALEPDVLLLDEVLSVGDAAFRAKCFHRIGKLLGKCSVVFVSHDPIQMSRICDRCLFLNKGEVIAIGDTQEILAEYENATGGAESKPSTVLHPDVGCFSCELDVCRIDWGGFLRLNLKLELAENHRFGLALLALLDGETSVVQSDVTEILNSSSGNDRSIIIDWGPLYLRGGNYSLVVTILDETKKRTLVHAVRCANVYVTGAKGYGVVYQAACRKVCL